MTALKVLPPSYKSGPHTSRVTDMDSYIKPQVLKDTKPVQYEMFIDGRWCASSTGKVLERVAPGHGHVVSLYQEGSGADTVRAIAAARKAFDTGPWPHMTAAERSGYLHKVADLIDRNKEVIAQLDAVESGKPISQVRGEVGGAIDIWRYAAALARTLYGETYNNLGQQALGLVLREPIGVVSIITPWNFPFLIVAQKLPFALAAGCTTVVKPSELSSGSMLFLAKLITEAGIPAGVVNVVTGTGIEVGSVMTSDPCVNMVSFTGSTGVGRAAMANAAQTLKKVSLELGGKNPQIVFTDADLEAFTDAAVFGGYFNAGECCNAGSRIIAHEDIADEVVGRIAALSKNVRLGDPLHDDTQVGAIITPQHLGKIESYLALAKAEGARVDHGGNRLDLGAGHYMEPTIITEVLPAMKVAQEEIFGPVISVLKFGTIQQALGVANGTSFGLSASVWSKNIDTCLEVSRAVRAGTVWVNTFMDGTPELPFGGMNQSGLGRELGRHGVEDYTESKTLNIHQGPRTSWWIRK
jgi:betaine-aldehyde dehydrogenase